MKQRIITFFTVFVLCLFLIPNSVNAEETTSDFIDDVYVKKDEKAIALQFNLKKEINIWDSSYITIQYCFDTEDGGDCIGKYGTNNKVTLDKKPLVDTTNKSVVEKDLMQVGDTIFIYIVPTEENLFSNSGTKLSDVYEKINEVYIYIGDNTYNSETITLDLNSNEIKSIDKSHDYEQESVDTINDIVISILGYGWSSGDMLIDTDNNRYETEYKFSLLGESEANIKLIISDFTNKTKEQLEDEIKSQLKNQVVNKDLEVNLSQDLVNKDLFESIKKNQNKVSLNYNEDDQTLYTWIFDGSKIDSTDYDVDLNLTIGTSTNQKKIENMLSEKNSSLVLGFSHVGDLPKGTEVKIFVGDKYKDGDNLILWYYNAKKNQLEKINENVTVSDEYVTLSIEHCSEYVLTTKDTKIIVKETSNDTNNQISNNAQTSSMNINLYIAFAVISLVGMVLTVVATKKKLI